MNWPEKTLLDICRRASLPQVAVAAGHPEQGEFLWTQGANPSDLFLTASLTKPIVAILVLRAVERGLVALDDRLGDCLSGTVPAGIRRITIRHLLTHTSGLPEVWQDNRALRAAHSGAAEFVQAGLNEKPIAPAGSQIVYSSVGYSLLGGVLEEILGCSLALQFQDTFASLPDAAIARLGRLTADEENPASAGLPVQLPDWQSESDDWNWNSPYWRSLGAAWGGMMTSARFLAALLRSVSPVWAESQPPLLSRRSVREMFSNQATCFPAISAADQQSRAWGLGFRRNWPGHASSFGDLLGRGVYGHWGATGTLMWLEPATGSYAVILTTVPYERSRSAIHRISNVLATALPDET